MNVKAEFLDAEINLRFVGLLTGKTIKTVQRWCDDGKIPSRVVDLRGKRMTKLSAILPLTDIEPDDAYLVVEAAAGDPEAQNEIGIIFLEAGKPQIAIEWFQEAAERNHADAMHWLSKYYFSGKMGVEQNRDIATKWLAAAAAEGHVIAKAQMRSLHEGMSDMALDTNRLSSVDPF